MNDYISRAAALTALGERPLVWTDRDEYALGARNQYDRDVLAIQTVPANDSNALECDGMRWIPCEERLPEMPGEYLVEYAAEDMTFHRVLYYWINHKVWGTGWHDMGNPLDTFTDHSIDMVAWMPLPEPYMEEE